MMEIKPPVVISAVVLLLVLLFGGYKLYERSRLTTDDERPPLTVDQYQGPRATQTGQ